jgi:anti-sigma factor RsiW
MASATSPAGPHVRDQLESYLIGELNDDDEFAVERHLLRCSVCRNECDELANVALMVSRLPASIAREIVEATGSAPVGPALPARRPPAGDRSVNGLPARLSVTLADRADGSVDVRAVLVGVQPGLDTELLAVTADQRIISVSRQAGGDPQQVVGRLPANAGKLLFLIVVDPDHRVLALTFM